VSGKDIGDRGSDAAEREAAPTDDQKAMNHPRPHFPLVAKSRPPYARGA
jgi:hypothetical protein